VTTGLTFTGVSRTAKENLMIKLNFREQGKQERRDEE
jgi:hypothetical protein